MLISTEYIKEQLSRSEKYWSSGAFGGSITILSSILNSIDRSDLLQAEKANIRDKILNLELTPKILDIIYKELKLKAERINKILSVGEKYNDDEFVLVLTLFFEIKLINDVLLIKKVNLFEFDYKLVAETIKHIGGKLINRKAYKRSLRLIKKNWGFPVDFLYFEDEIREALEA